MRMSGRTVAATCLVIVLSSPFASAPVVAQAEKFGAGVSDRAVTPIADLHATPDAFVGKTVRVDGVVTSVCTDMGCWMVLAPADKPDQAVRVKVDDDAGIVFPIAARGRSASAEGVFEKIAADDAEAKNAAAEQGATGPGAAFSAAYQIKATGAVIR